jgi:hypothetical protein
MCRDKTLLCVCENFNGTRGHGEGVCSSLDKSPKKGPKQKIFICARRKKRVSVSFSGSQEACSMFDWLLVKRQRKKVGDVLTVPNARGFFWRPLSTEQAAKEGGPFIH